MDHNDASKDANARVTKSSQKAKYACNFCPNSYSRKQALGGHQNAHRKERKLIMVPANQPDPLETPSPYPYVMRPRFEGRPPFGVGGENGLAMVDPMFSRFPFTTGNSRWAVTERLKRALMPQPQLLLPAPPSPLCLDQSRWAVTEESSTAQPQLLLPAPPSPLCLDQSRWAATEESSTARPQLLLPAPPSPLCLDQSRWAATEESSTAQPQLLLPAPPTPLCLDLCLGIGNSSKAQMQPQEPKKAMRKMVDEEGEYDGLCLSLSLPGYNVSR